MKTKTPKKKKLTPEQRAGNQLFKQEVRRLGVKGFVDNQVKMAEDKKKDAMAAADAIMDENVGPIVSQYMPSFRFNYAPGQYERIFGHKEGQNGNGTAQKS